MFSEPIQTISGLNFNINSVFVSKINEWKYKSEICSCTHIGNYYMLYVNQAYIENQHNQLEGLFQLLLSLSCMRLLDFGPYYAHNLDTLYTFISRNISQIVQLSEISFAFDYQEQDINYQLPKLSKLETTLLRHQSLWCVYDKRVYCSNSYKNYRNQSSLYDHPIRLEFHINLKYASRYLNLVVLNQSEEELLCFFMGYTYKSYKRNCMGKMPLLPYSYYQTGRVSHSSLPLMKTA